MAQQSTDVVAILDNASNQILATARPLRATVFDISKIMEHPLETGSVIADHLVRDPVEIDLPLVITGSEAAQVFAELRQHYLAGDLLTVLTRMGSYTSMVLIEIPHDEVPEAADSVTVGVKFREARFITPAKGGYAPKHKKRAKTKKRGAQQTTTANTATEQRGSLLYRFAHRGG